MKPVLGKSAYMRADFGYEKIPCDLRQVPKNLLKMPNCDYAFLTHKMDQHLSVSEKVLHILDALDKLEQTTINTVNRSDEPKSGTNPQIPLQQTVVNHQ